MTRKSFQDGYEVIPKKPNLYQKILGTGGQAVVWVEEYNPFVAIESNNNSFSVLFVWFWICIITDYNLLKF